MNYNNNDNGMWDWEGEENLCNVFDETTPAKSFEDLGYQITENENINKETEQCREAYLQVKRRRMLHFDNEVLDVDMIPISDHDFSSSSYLKSKEREASLDGVLSDITQWVDGFADDSCASGSGYQGLDQSSEGWLADCLINDTDMQLTANDDLNPSKSTAVHIDLTESNNSEPENGGQEIPTPTRQNIIIKGKKSLTKIPSKKASSVVLPFAIVKPCGMQGAITLKDINQKILTPPLSKSKKNKEDSVESYPTSAFSGKPVVGKTKIRTEGGKGSITIMRTKG